MSEPHKRNRHPKYKTANYVKNWTEYYKTLRDRGNITLWISQDAIETRTPPQAGKRGGQRLYSDLAIETALTFRLLFHLPLRQTEGFLHSILTLMGLALPCPDHTPLSRRNATVEIRRLDPRWSSGSVDLIVDSTGLKVCVQGEWHSQKYGEKKRNSWKNIHLGVDKEVWIIAQTVTDDHEQDPSQAPALVFKVDREIERFIADGIYDQAPVYAAVTSHSPGAHVIILPRKDAVPSPEAGTSPTQRDWHLFEIQRNDRFHWKRTSGYYDQAHAENAFSRYKRTFGGGLRAKRYEAQKREASLGCVLLKRLRELSRPQSYTVR